MLEIADAPGNAGCLGEVGIAGFLAFGTPDTHQCELVCGIFAIQVHLSPPAWAGMPMHGRWLV